MENTEIFPNRVNDIMGNANGNYDKLGVKPLQHHCYKNTQSIIVAHHYI